MKILKPHLITKAVSVIVISDKPSSVAFVIHTCVEINDNGVLYNVEPSYEVLCGLGKNNRYFKTFKEFNNFMKRQYENCNMINKDKEPHQHLKSKDNFDFKALLGRFLEMDKCVKEYNENIDTRALTFNSKIHCFKQMEIVMDAFGYGIKIKHCKKST